VQARRGKRAKNAAARTLAFYIVAWPHVQVANAMTPGPHSQHAAHTITQAKHQGVHLSCRSRLLLRLLLRRLRPPRSRSRSRSRSRPPLDL
jgi:hypothetical protein